MTRPTTLVCLVAATLVAACSDQPTSPVAVTTPPPVLGKGGVSSGTHFTSASATLVNPNLVVDFKISGVGAGTSITVTATADAEATESCVNGGTNIPSDKKKTTSVTPVIASGEFPATAGGNVIGSLTLLFPAPSLVCPSGQVATLISGSWSNIQLSTPSPSGGPVISISVSGTFTVE